MRRAFGIAAVAAGSFALTVCDRAVDPPQLLPPDAEQFSPPAVYSTWWNMTQACSGLSGSLAGVTWYKTTQPLHDPRTEEVLGGYWISGSNQIVLLSTAMLYGPLVRHEMLHALLRGGGHPRNQFLGKCAGTVSCSDACIADAGPYPQPPEQPVQVRSDLFDITVDVEPGNPTSAHDGGHFSITVTAHNPSTHWATAAPLASDFDATRTFSFDVVGQTGGQSRNEMAMDPSQRIFAPGETKKFVFDFVIGDDAFANQLSPGNYAVRGAFSDHWSGYSSFVIGP
jgi:hypothetical protein